MTSIPKTIKQFNAGRNPDILPLKYKAMHADAFVFYRGSCHLFYEQLLTDSCLRQSPLTWVCGDMHLENFGCYKADNGLVYMAINDFDESVLAPGLFDVSRLLASIFLAKNSLKIEEATAKQLSKRFLKVYVEALLSGRAELVDDRLAHGVMQDFLLDIETRKRCDFVKARTVKTDDQVRLLIDNKKTFKIKDSLKKQISKAVAKWAKTQANPDFYRVLDVSGRIAGTGSLGIDRYLLLVNGNGQNNHYLLDMKTASPSCLTAFSAVPQPAWNNEAQRITEVQKRIQTYPTLLLNVMEFDKKSFVIKELQAWADKINLASFKGKIDKLTTVIDTYAKLIAWSQLRSSGRDNSASVDEWIAFANNAAQWKQPLLAESRFYAELTEKNYQKFCKAYDKGYFNV
jgi:uncharacterized protein (DUF2252 family)